MNTHYSVDIRWSEEDQKYLVALPEWEGRVINWDSVTAGVTIEEAARNAEEVLAMLVEDAIEDGEDLPAVRTAVTA